MSTETAGGRVSRREVMQRAVFLVGGAAAVTQLGACSKDAAAPAAEEPIADAVTRHADVPVGRYFDVDRMARLDEISEIIIPTTDTPGARAAGVPKFIDDMMVDWAKAETAEKYKNVLDAIEARAQKGHGASFMDLDADKRFAVVRDYDRNALSAGDEDYRAFKELVLLGYYHSEVGATVELRYELVPGAWRACVPFEEIGRAWAA